MRGDTSVGQIFEEIGYLCTSEGCSFTLVDIEGMYPYEREMYVQFVQEKKKKQSEGIANMAGNDGGNQGAIPRFDPAMGIE